MGPPASALYSGAPWVDSCTVDRPLHLGLMHGGTTPTLQEGTQLSAVPSSSCSAGCGWVAVRLRITHCGLNALAGVHAPLAHNTGRKAPAVKAHWR